MEKYQTLFPRLAALIIDILILFPFALLDAWLRAEGTPYEILLVWSAAFNAASPFYFIMMHGLYGQTLGKMALRVKVLDASENPLGFRRALLRDIPSLVFSAGFFVFDVFRLPDDEFLSSLASPSGVLFLLISLWTAGDALATLLNERRRALHDFIAGSVVVNARFSFRRGKSVE